VVDNNEQTIFAAQFIIHSLPLGQYYLYCPYGPVSNDSLTQIIDQIKVDFPKALFLKFESQHSISISGKHGHRVQPGKTLIVDLHKSHDELLSEMHPKTRYNIKVAQKHEVKISAISQYPHEAIKLISETGSRQGYRNHPHGYFEKLVHFFQESTQVECSLYTATYKNTVISSAIMVDFAGTRTYLFGGSSDKDKNVMAPYLLHWQAMQDAKVKGLSQYDFWGIETSKGGTPGFVRFKLGFGGTQVEYPKPIDVTWRPLQYLAYNIARKFL
jgi:lipid II:glycine glycyltransferase (peptidoglycan interpeptide bridge formation enzyme)